MVAGTGIDVTEQEQLTLELQRRVRILQRFKGSAIQGTLAGAFPAREIFWSDETFRIFEFAPRSPNCRFKPILNCVHPENIPSVNIAITAGPQAEVFFVEFRLPDAGWKDQVFACC